MSIPTKDRRAWYHSPLGMLSQRIASWLDTPKGFPLGLLLLRSLALMAVLLRFLIYWGLYAGSVLGRVFWFTSLAYALWILFWGYMNLSASHWFVSRRAETVQMLSDTVVFSVFYLLTQDPKSDLFILYLLPLMAAARFLNPTTGLLFLTSTLISFLAVLYTMGTVFVVPAASAVIVVGVFVPRAAFLALITLASMLSYGQARRSVHQLARWHQVPQMLGEVGRLVESQLVALYLYDELSDDLVVAATRGPDKEGHSLASQAMRMYVGSVIRGKLPVLVNEMATDPRVKHLGMSKMLASALWAPIVSGSHSLGAIALASTEKNAFTEADLDLSLSLLSKWLPP